MLNRIKKLLSAAPATSAAEEKDRVQVAACVLLLEMAHSDEEFHEMESVLIRDLLQKKFELSDEAAQELIELAQIERRESLDLYQFTSQINNNFSIEEKLEIMEGLWRIIYADGVLDKYEEYLARRLTDLLRLSHRQMIEAKVKILNEMRANGSGDNG